MTDPRFVLKPVAYLWAWRLSLVLYTSSFAAAVRSDRVTIPPRRAIFYLGFLFCVFPGFFSWWANPLICAALIQSVKGPTWTAFALALFAFLLSASYQFLVNHAVVPVPVNPVLGPAYWAWTGSMGVLATGLGVSLTRLDFPDTRPIEDEGESRPLAPVAGQGDEHVQPPPR